MTKTSCVHSVSISKRTAETTLIGEHKSHCELRKEGALGCPENCPEYKDKVDVMLENRAKQRKGVTRSETLETYSNNQTKVELVRQNSSGSLQHMLKIRNLSGGEIILKDFDDSVLMELSNFFSRASDKMSLAKETRVEEN